MSPLDLLCLLERPRLEAVALRAGVTGGGATQELASRIVRARCPRGRVPESRLEALAQLLEADELLDLMHNTVWRGNLATYAGTDALDRLDVASLRTLLVALGLNAGEGMLEEVVLSERWRGCFEVDTSATPFEDEDDWEGDPFEEAQEASPHGPLPSASDAALRWKLPRRCGADFPLPASPAAAIVQVSDEGLSALEKWRSCAEAAGVLALPGDAVAQQTAMRHVIRSIVPARRVLWLARGSNALDSALELSLSEAAHASAPFELGWYGEGTSSEVAHLVFADAAVLDDSPVRSIEALRAHCGDFDLVVVQDSREQASAKLAEAIRHAHQLWPEAQFLGLTARHEQGASQYFPWGRELFAMPLVPQARWAPEDGVSAAGGPALHPTADEGPQTSYWLARAHGLATLNRKRHALVEADGELVQVTRAQLTAIQGAWPDVHHALTTDPSALEGVTAFAARQLERRSNLDIALARRVLRTAVREGRFTAIDDAPGRPGLQVLADELRRVPRARWLEVLEEVRSAFFSEQHLTVDGLLMALLASLLGLDDGQSGAGTHSTAAPVTPRAESA